jgi:predicted homoserine dehydrogenase-like protein
MMVRGMIDPADDFAREGLAPLGVLAGAVLKHDVPVDHVVTYDDVELDESSLIVRMRRIQETMDKDPSNVPTLAELRAELKG